MPTSKEIKAMAKKRHMSAEQMAKQVFGHLRATGWKPKREKR